MEEQNQSQESQSQESQTQENQAQQQPQKSSGKKTIIMGVLIAVIAILLAVLLLNRNGNDATDSVELPTATTTPAPTTSEKTSSSLSGTVALKGPIPSGSKLAIGVKSQTNPTYQPLIEELQAVDGVKWEWKDAIQGNNYNVQAFLVNENEDLISQSQVENVTAPTSGVALTINYSSDLEPPPTNSFNIVCKDKNANGVWRVDFTYNINNPTSSALQYRLGIGTSSNGDLVLDAIVKPKSPDVAQTYTTDYIINPGQTYYAAYAYADCASCDEFSPASNWEQFSCTVADTPTPTP